MNDWQISYRGLVMGDGTPYVVQSVTGLQDTPGVRTSDFDRARVNGQIAGADLASGRAVTANILVDGPHPSSSVWDAFSRALVIGGPEEELGVKVPGLASGIEVVIFARCRRLNLASNQDYAAGVGNATVEWWATDPRIYSATPASLSTGQASATGTGRTYDRTYPLSYGGAVTGGVLSATNDGEFPAPWVATITGPVDNPRIENVVTGDVVSFNGSLSASDVLTVSSDFRTVILNGTASRYSWLASGSRWFNLAPGLNQIRFAGSGGAGSLTLEYRSTWI